MKLINSCIEKKTRRNEKWEKEHLVKERKIKRRVTRPAEDVGDILIIGANDIVRIVGLGELQN